MPERPRRWIRLGHDLDQHPYTQQTTAPQRSEPNASDSALDKGNRPCTLGLGRRRELRAPCCFGQPEPAISVMRGHHISIKRRGREELVQGQFGPGIASRILRGAHAFNGAALVAIIVGLVWGLNGGSWLWLVAIIVAVVVISFVMAAFRARG